MLSLIILNTKKNFTLLQKINFIDSMNKVPVDTACDTYLDSQCQQTAACCMAGKVDSDFAYN